MASLKEKNATTDCVMTLERSDHQVTRSVLVPSAPSGRPYPSALTLNEYEYLYASLGASPSQGYPPPPSAPHHYKSPATNLHP